MSIKTSDRFYEAVTRESEARYLKLIELSPLPIAIHANGIIVYANNAAVHLMGAKKPQELLGKKVMRFVHPDYRELVKKRIAEVYTGKRTHTGIAEEKFIRLDGETIYVEVVSLSFNYKEKPAIQVVFRDITQQKQIEEELRTREERFRLLVQNSSDIILVFSPTGEIQYQSSSIKKLLGSTDMVIHPDDIFLYNDLLAKALAHPKDMVKAEFRIQHKNGTWRMIEAVCQSFVADPRIGGIVANYRDITQRKLVEEIVDEERQKVSAVLESTNEGIYGTDAQGICIFINPAMLKLVGYKEKDCLGQNLHYLLHHSHLDGSTYFIEDCPINNSLKSGRSIRLVEDALWTKTHKPIDVLLSCSPTKEGTILTGSVVTVIDVRERKKLEQQKDVFIGMVSHELKTPVTSIKAYAQVLQHRFAKQGDERSASLLGKMDGQLDKLTNLIKDLLDITRIDAGKLQYNEERFDFNQLVLEIVEEMQRTTDHMLVLHLAKAVNILADRDRIGQILINFISNAIKYSPQSEKILISTKLSKEYVTASVKDFGVGIPKKQQQHVFEKFYRGDETGQSSYPGLGLGLYISSEIAKRHMGKIWVKSTEGKGATFSFSLPIK